MAAVTQTFWFNKLTAESQPSMGKDWFASED